MPINTARLTRRLSAAMIVRSAMSSCGLFTWRRTTRSWWRRSSNSASGSRKQPHIEDVEHQAQERVGEGEQHPTAILAASYRHSG
jgi:hypothetical protein